MSIADPERQRQNMVELSIVIPVYNAEGCLPVLHQRLTDVLRRLTATYEIVLVDDRSTDQSWPVIVQLAKQDSRVRAYRLSRNFGQHAAITAGLRQSGGSWAVVMDCDLQDPPEDIPRLYAKALEGFDVVLARRSQRRDSLFRRLTARFYFALLGLFNQTPLEHEYGSFSIISRKVINACLAMQDRARHYLFLLRWLGFTVGSIDYEQAERFTGRSGYTLTRLIHHAFDGIFFQTTVFLRWIVYLGFAIAASAFILAAYLVFHALTRDMPPGWTSLAVLILFIGGLITISVGVAGLYIGKIFDEVRQRPLFVISEQIVDGIEQ
jgi:dolichol-phosphate mannosyltransferase